MERARAFRTQLEGHLNPIYGGCTRETTRCADARDYNADLRPCCRGHVRQIVVDATAALRANGMVFWADYGTLLGAVRNPLLGFEPGIIPHDKDADFGVLGVEKGPDLVRLNRVAAQLRKKGYNVTVRPHGRSMKVRLSATNHTNADFFLWRERMNGMLYRDKYISVDAFKGRDFPREWITPLSTVAWEGMTLPAPADPAAFCAFRYGPNWMTPIRANNDGVAR